MIRDLGDMRQDYRYGLLTEDSVSKDPIEQFNLWFRQAEEAGIREPNAMTLATATTDGKPSARIVLMKGISTAGIQFYTNYDSRKGQELIANPKAALLFFWHDTERQVRLEGIVHKMTEEASDAYFDTRPVGSRIGAIASPQSQVIQGRTTLEEKVKMLEDRYLNSEHIPRPENWGGFILEPERFEFWQGRTNRLHDRIVYIKQADENWKIERLAP